MKRLVAGLVTVCAVATGCGGTSAAPEPPAQAVTLARDFLERYVEPDGRVVRHDQGGDTVSEGQAYALLLATAAGDHDLVRTVWTWTSDQLRRSDGLLSWRWADGAVRDPNSATDADLDAARALVLAGDRFDDDTLRTAGTTLADAVLDHETKQVADGRVLVAGNWAHTTPYAVNPSYFSPVANEQLEAATGDQRWADVDTTGSRLLIDLATSAPLPPDWASIDTTGLITPTTGPNGDSPRFGLDAARVALRHAESCDPDDRALAAATELGTTAENIRAAYTLDGTPLADWQHPLPLLSAAAAADANDEPEQADALLAAATRLEDRSPTYYGAAWVALAHTLLRTPLLNDCRS